jgi:hypothetical protein
MDAKQILRDGVIRFNLRGPDGLVDGRPSKPNDEQRRALVAMVEPGPIPVVHGVVRRRLIDSGCSVQIGIPAAADWWRSVRRIRIRL